MILGVPIILRVSEHVFEARNMFGMFEHVLGVRPKEARALFVAIPSLLVQASNTSDRLEHVLCFRHLFEHLEHAQTSGR